jgi:hypothetical protein
MYVSTDAGETVIKRALHMFELHFQVPVIYQLAPYDGVYYIVCMGH